MTINDLRKEFESLEETMIFSKERDSFGQYENDVLRGMWIGYFIFAVKHGYVAKDQACNKFLDT